MMTSRRLTGLLPGLVLEASIAGAKGVVQRTMAPLWVKTRRTQHEQLKSAIAHLPDLEEARGHFPDGPIRDICRVIVQQKGRPRRPLCTFLFVKSVPLARA